MQRGLFITFEGPDGAGKTTQINTFATYLHETGRQFLVTREPGGTRISDIIRALILDPEYTEMNNETEVLLYAASRAQHVREKILPALKRGLTVLCDRYVDASVAYQGYGLQVDVEQVLALNAFATSGLMPDRSYFIDIAPDKARNRLFHRNEKEGLDRIEQKELSYHEKVRDGFRLIYEQNKDRICFINGHQSIEEVFAVIKSDFERMYNKT